MELLRAVSTDKIFTGTDENIQLNGRCLHQDKSVENCKSLVASIKHQSEDVGRQLSSALEENDSLRTEIRTVSDELTCRLDSMVDLIASMRNDAAAAKQDLAVTNQRAIAATAEAAAARQDAALANQRATAATAEAAAARQDAALANQLATAATAEAAAARQDAASARQYAAVANQLATAATEQLSALQGTVDGLVASTALFVI